MWKFNKYDYPSSMKQNNTKEVDTQLKINEPIK